MLLHIMYTYIFSKITKKKTTLKINKHHYGITSYTVAEKNCIQIASSYLREVSTFYKMRMRLRLQQNPNFTPATYIKKINRLTFEFIISDSFQFFCLIFITCTTQTAEKCLMSWQQLDVTLHINIIDGFSQSIIVSKITCSIVFETFWFLPKSRLYLFSYGVDFGS